MIIINHYTETPTKERTIKKQRAILVQTIDGIFLGNKYTLKEDCKGGYCIDYWYSGAYEINLS